jgi:hypothetical protein
VLRSRLPEYVDAKDAVVDFLANIGITSHSD